MSLTPSRSPRNRHQSCHCHQDSSLLRHHSAAICLWLATLKRIRNTLLQLNIAKITVMPDVLYTGWLVSDWRLDRMTEARTGVGSRELSDDALDLCVSRVVSKVYFWTVKSCPNCVSTMPNVRNYLIQIFFQNNGNRLQNLWFLIS